MNTPPPCQVQVDVTIRVTDSQIRLVVGLEMAESVLAVARDLAMV